MCQHIIRCVANIIIHELVKIFLLRSSKICDGGQSHLPAKSHMCKINKLNFQNHKNQCSSRKPAHNIEGKKGIDGNKEEKAKKKEEERERRRGR